MCVSLVMMRKDEDGFLVPEVLVLHLEVEESPGRRVIL